MKGKFLIKGKRTENGESKVTAYIKVSKERERRLTFCGSCMCGKMLDDKNIF